MFEPQLQAMRVAIRRASRLRFEAAVGAYTNILKERLDIKNGHTHVAAILFLTNDEIGDVYCMRAYAYEKLADRYLKSGQSRLASGYYRSASSDTKNALNFYDDLDEKRKCRIQLKEDKENREKRCVEQEGMGETRASKRLCIWQEEKKDEKEGERSFAEVSHTSV